jgi:hypothetical protein
MAKAELTLARVMMGGRVIHAATTYVVLIMLLSEERIIGSKLASVLVAPL